MDFSSPNAPPVVPVEADPRFPSGPWHGFFLMAHWPGRHMMELHLSFHQGVMTGEGRDQIGPFLIRGKYDLDDGKCWWTKRYIGKHDVVYQGYNEGKGIWGALGNPPVLARWVPHLAGNRWEILRLPGSPRQSPNR